MKKETNLTSWNRKTIFLNWYPGKALNRIILSFAVFSLFLLAACSQDVVLVKDGEPVSVIVIPDNPSEEVNHAAYELQSYVGKCSGASLAVLLEDQLNSREDLPESCIFVGPCRRTGEAIDQESLKAEELVVHTAGTNLYLTGGEGGTKYAVSYWLNEYLGVDWIMPGEFGEFTPHNDNVTVGKTDYRYQPPVLERTLRNIPWIGKSRTGIERICKKAGIEDIEDTLNSVGMFYSSAHEAPFRRWGGGVRIASNFGHSFGDYWDKYGEEHPEFFALQSNGSREQNPTRERLCVSEPTLWDFVAQRKIEEFKRNPERKMASICPNYGGPNDFCMCDRCRSWDPEDAPKIRHGLLVNPQTGEPWEEYPSLSDRYFRFYNEVAKRVAEVYPDKKLGVYAYSVYRTVPVNLDKIHPNITVKLVTIDKQLIDEWSKVTTEGQLFLRPNTMWSSSNLGFVRNSARWIADGVKYAVENGTIGFDFDGGVWDWGSQGLEYYVLVHVMWDPSVDVDQLIENYYPAAYGEGAPAMKKFHERVEKLTTRIREEDRYRGRKSNPEVLGEYYSDELIAELQRYIDEAKSAVGNSSSPEYLRIQVVEEGLQYTRLGSRLLRAAGKADGSSDPEFQEAERVFYDYLRTHLRSYAVNAGITGGFYYYSAPSYALRN